MKIPFRTVSGLDLNLADPKRCDIQIADIACALARICRFNGQLREFYSVAQHSWLVSMIVDSRLTFPALLHDASEAYLGDVGRFLKHSAAMRAYRRLEAQWTNEIEARYQLHITDYMRSEIKTADDLIALYERTWLREHPARPLTPEFIQECVRTRWVKTAAGPLLRLADQSKWLYSKQPLRTWMPHFAEQKFLEHFDLFYRRSR